MPPRGRGRGRCPPAARPPRPSRPVGTATTWARRRWRRRSLRARRRPGLEDGGWRATGRHRRPRPRRSPRLPGRSPRATPGHRRTVENRKNDRPAVRNRSPIDATLLSGGMGRGMRSASGPRRSRNSAPSVGGSGTWSDGPERAAQPGRLVRGQPDRHVAAVDHDHERVAGDADERERHARVAAVLPEREQQQPVGEAEQRQAQLADEVDAVDDRGLGREPEDDAREQQRQELEADIRQPLDLSAEEQAEQEPDGDAGDQHRGILGWGTVAMSGVSGERRTRPTGSAPERSAADQRAKRWGRPLSSDPPSQIPRGRP